MKHETTALDDCNDISPQDSLPSFSGCVLRVGFEVVKGEEGSKRLCTAVIDDGTGADLELMTNDSGIEAALLAAYRSTADLDQKPSNVDVEYEKSGDNLMLTRIELIDAATRTRRVRLKRTYDRAAALAYARDRWSRVSSDNYIGVGSSPGYQAVPASTTFVRTTPTDPQTEVARASGMADIPLAELEDCAHFVSCCIGQPPGQAGGGLPIGRDFPSAIYGRISARRLFQDVKDNGLVTIVGPERMSPSAAGTRLAAGEIGAADLIFYYFNNSQPGHVGLYLADSQKRIACHTYCRCDQSSDYDQAWDSVNAFTHITLAKVN